MEPTVQNAELATYVVGAVSLLKPIVKGKVPAEYVTIVLVAISALSGAFFNVALYGLTLDIASQGLFVGAVASGFFGAAKEISAAVKKK